jgi:two-component system sporulation sensor kinase B
LNTFNNLLLNLFIILLSIVGSFVLYHLLKGKYTRLTNAVLLSISVILCMSFPFILFPGQIYDMRIVILLLAILYGGYRVGGFVTAVTFLYRYFLGGFGFIQMAITFPPILAIAFYLIPRFRNYSRLKKIIVSASLDIAIVVANLTFVISRYSMARWHVTFLLEWAVLEAIAIVIMVFLLEIMTEHIVMQQHMQELEKSQLVSALTASIAHEIRNPLTVCRGFLQLLHERITDDQQRVYADTILSELNHAASIIDDYLSFSKPQIEKIERTDAAQIVAQTIETMLPYATEKSVDIEQDLERGLYIHIDPLKFKQALLNIIKNGIEAMPNGGKLTVTLRRQRHMATVEISDTGIGMSEEQINKLGNPFYSTKATGTGLGLMASYRFIQLMKGKIEVMSVKGLGTQFSIHVPLMNGSSKKDRDWIVASKESDKTYQIRI